VSKVPDRGDFWSCVAAAVGRAVMGVVGLPALGGSAGMGAEQVANVTIELHHRADERHHRYLARERERGVLIPGDKDALLMPASVLTLHARTAHYTSPAPDEDPAFVWPPRPW
jgi:hypothetical protein